MLTDASLATILPVLVRTAERIVGRSWAEDVAHTAVIRAMERLRQYDAQRSLEAWMVGIVRHAALDFVRHRKFETAGMEYLEPQADERERSDEETTALREELEALPLIYREALAHTAIDGEQAKDYAESTGQRAVTIRWRASEGRRMLRKALIARGVEL